MFHQTIFYPSRSAGNIAGLHNAAAASPSKATPAAASPEKASSFLDLRKQYFQNQNTQQQRFGIASSNTTTFTTTTATSATSIGGHRNEVFAQSTQTEDPTEVAPPRFGAFVLNPLRLPPRSPAIVSPSKDFSKKNEDNHTDIFRDLEPTKSSKSNKRNSAKVRRGSEADTATTASIATSVSSPTPSFLSNSSSLEDGGEAERVEFLLDRNEKIPDWISDGRSSEDLDAANTLKGESNVEGATKESKMRSQRMDYEYEYEDGDDDDMCSCSTPVLTNTSRQQQLFQEQQQHQQQTFVSREEASVTTTTTTETKTTTTTTTQTTTSSSVNTSGMISSSTAMSRTLSDEDLVLMPHLFSEMSGGHERDLPLVDIQRKSSNNNIAAMDHHQKCESSSAIATTSESTMAAESPPCYCKSCASKQRQIDRQRKELRHMKGMMKKLCLLLADTVRAQEESKNKIDEGKLLAPDPNANAITDGSDHEIISSTPSTSSKISQSTDSGNASNTDQEGDSFSVATSSTTLTSSTSYASTSSSSLASTTSSKFVPRLHRPRITSLPVTSVGKDCPRIKNERIQVSGQWGSYSGPSLNITHKASQSEKDAEVEDEDEPSDAGILLGCVVRLDDTSLYVGSLSRNDTGSFIFHPPGTLYDHTGKPMRRIK